MKHELSFIASVPPEKKSTLINMCLQVHQLSETAGWLDVVPPTPDTAGARLVTVLPQDQQGFGNYAQVTLLSRNPSIRETLATETPLTFGRSVVTYIYGWDKINDVM
jgi:hypothetical protein